ncbi:MAG: DUF3187 family protein [Gammaproteobacteria bacterium]|nr:DUF3187 family protein [Gammaproteobacteria bacterium]
MRRLIRLFLLITTALPIAAHARDTDPLPMYNQTPFAQIFGLPALGAARVLARDKRTAGVGYEVANYFVHEQRGNEQLIIDGETHRTNVNFSIGTAYGEFGIEIPHLSHSGGSLDSFIESWHDTFNQKQGGRPQVEDNQLIYSYRRDGVDLLNFRNATDGVGDVRLTGAWALASGGSVDVALHTSLKLPTGNADKLLGSGAADAAIWFAAGCGVCTGRWSGHANGGLLWLGDGEVLSSLQRRVVAFLGTGVGLTVWEPVTFKAALYAHTPFYDDTEMRPLGLSTVQLIFGGSWTASKDVTVDLGFSEDIRVYTAPDISILLNMRAGF